MWEDTCVRLGMSGNLLNAIFVKVDMFLRTALLTPWLPALQIGIPQDTEANVT